MDLNVGKEFAALRRMTVNELRAKYAEVFGEETNARHKQWLERRILWRMQALPHDRIPQMKLPWFDSSRLTNPQHAPRRTLA